MKEQKYTHLATCPYCEQTMTVELDSEEPTESQLAEAAIEQCDCLDAKKAVRKRERLKDAKAAIHLMFASDEDSALRDLIYMATEEIVNERIASVQINFGFGRQIKVKEKNDKVRIMKIRREAEAEEV